MRRGRPSKTWGTYAAGRNGRRTHRSAAAWSSARVPFALPLRDSDGRRPRPNSHLRIEAAGIETARPAPDRAPAAEVGSESRVVGSKVGVPEAKKETRPTLPFRYRHIAPRPRRADGVDSRAEPIACHATPGEQAADGISDPSTRLPASSPNSLWNLAFPASAGVQADASEMSLPACCQRPRDIAHPGHPGPVAVEEPGCGDLRSPLRRK